ncbi:hypothetical protein MOVS_06380 [Moraxella ovis]|uniref:Uncharacterized protein n=1 Tax=Moraxella ovis TaxID=29433 RepID=A0A378PKQ3_9GAMM|nr:hypothetical protein [Moraxella ovis]ANB91670.1 hypothetical protein MOVS_06380 [Moraxella ovis]STY87334.1 Uncharacterised protein [Moraxella ovis]
MGVDGGIQDAPVVNEEEACESLCFNFHTKKKILLSKVGKNHVTIAKIIKEIRRGSKTKKQFSELNIDAVHITDLIDKDLVLKQRQYHHTPHAFNFAKEGDILIPRVGKRSIMRESLVASGADYYTDSIFKLTASTENETEILWGAISSDFGKEWRGIYSQGKCAKYLTCEALMSMPLLN